MTALACGQAPAKWRAVSAVRGHWCQSAVELGPGTDGELAGKIAPVQGQGAGAEIHARPAEAALSPGKPVSGPAKTYLSRQNRNFLRCAKEGLTARLNGDRRRDGRKPRRNDEPQRDAGHTGSAGSHRPPRRRDRRRVQLFPDPGGQLAEHPGAFLTPRELGSGAGPDFRSGSRARSCTNPPLSGRAHALTARAWESPGSAEGPDP
jgi:hypothetical protein